MRRRNLILLTCLIFVFTPILIFNYTSIPKFGASTKKSPTASIVLEPSSPVRMGPVTVKLTTSKNVTEVPAPLIFIESDSSISLIRLSGIVPGDTFMGILIVDQSIAEGLGYFSFLTKDALVDEERKKGKEITSGKYLRIDKTPPSKPQKLSGTFDSGLYTR